MSKLKNCWEYKKCGFGPLGTKTIAHGVCPAARENRLDSVHGGHNGGRACWVVDHTHDCGTGEDNGDFSTKYPACRKCSFYKKVQKEQGSEFEVSLLLNTYMQNK